MCHTGCVRQTVRILEIADQQWVLHLHYCTHSLLLTMECSNSVLRTGDRARVTLEFITKPEFVKEGMKLLFRYVLFISVRQLVRLTYFPLCFSVKARRRWDAVSNGFLAT